MFTIVGLVCCLVHWAQPVLLQMPAWGGVDVACAECIRNTVLHVPTVVTDTFMIFPAVVLAQHVQRPRWLGSRDHYKRGEWLSSTNGIAPSARSAWTKDGVMMSVCPRSPTKFW